jgi:hypothetical protein
MYHVHFFLTVQIGKNKYDFFLNSCFLAKKVETFRSRIFKFLHAIEFLTSFSEEKRWIGIFLVYYLKLISPFSFLFSIFVHFSLLHINICCKVSNFICQNPYQSFFFLQNKIFFSLYSQIM